MNCAIINPISNAMGGVINGDKHSTNATKKISSLVVMLLSNIFFLFGSWLVVGIDEDDRCILECKEQLYLLQKEIVFCDLV